MVGLRKDPQDVDAIAHAEATLGNYMLKTSDAYQVPENQRMNAEKKRRQMFLLEDPNMCMYIHGHVPFKRCSGR